MTSSISSASVAGPRAWAALGVLTVAVTLLAIDGTVLALAVPALTAELAPTSTQVLWIGDIYSFALAGLLVTMGNVADRVGRKRLLLIGSIGFGISSVVAAFAPTPELLIAARALLGISGATIMPSTLSIVRNLFDDPKQRTRAVAVWSAGATGGAAIGPLVGGALLENFWWGSVFLINVPVVAVTVVLGAILLPESRNPTRAPIDLVSAVLSFAAIVPIVYAIKNAIGGGDLVPILVAASVGLVAGVVFVRRQRRLATPLIDVSLFRIPAFSGAVAANALSIFAFVGLIFFFSQYLQLVRGLSPLQAGLVELPLTLASVIVIAFIGAIAARLGRGRSIGLGLAIAAVGLVLLAFATVIDGYVVLCAALGVVGIGVGISMTLSTDAVVSAAPKQRAGAASAIAETAYELGVALGIAVLGSLVTVVYRASLALPAGLSDDVRGALEESLPIGLRALEGSPDAASLVALAQGAFTTSVQWTVALAAVLLVVAAIIAARVIPSPRDE